MSVHSSLILSGLIQSVPYRTKSSTFGNLTPGYLPQATWAVWRVGSSVPLKAQSHKMDQAIVDMSSSQDKDLSCFFIIFLRLLRSYTRIRKVLAINTKHRQITNSVYFFCKLDSVALFFLNISLLCVKYLRQ